MREWIGKHRGKAVYFDVNVINENIPNGRKRKCIGKKYRRGENEI